MKNERRTEEDPDPLQLIVAMVNGKAKEGLILLTILIKSYIICKCIANMTMVSTHTKSIPIHALDMIM